MTVAMVVGFVAMTIGDPYARDAVSGAFIAVSAALCACRYEAESPALERSGWYQVSRQVGQARLAASRVLVVGAGGLGSPVLLSDGGGHRYDWHL